MSLKAPSQVSSCLPSHGVDMWIILIFSTRILRTRKEGAGRVLSWEGVEYRERVVISMLICCRPGSKEPKWKGRVS